MLRDVIDAWNKAQQRKRDIIKLLKRIMTMLGLVVGDTRAGNLWRLICCGNTTRLDILDKNKYSLSFSPLCDVT